MANSPRFIDDEPVAAALREAATAAVERLAASLPELGGPPAEALGQHLRDYLESLLTGKAPTGSAAFPRLVHGRDAFGDPFHLADLPLPRGADGYAVQRLDTDTLLDRRTGAFLPVRDAALQGLFPSFDAAYQAARAWITGQGTTVDAQPLAIVPAAYDETMQRHILIYGVLTDAP